MAKRKEGSKSHIVHWLILALVAFIGAGCSLFNPQSPQILPTPPATAIPLDVQLVGSQEIVTDPTVGAFVKVEPTCESLMNAVSNQQLMAYVQTLEGFGTRNTFSETEGDDWGIGAARRWLFGEFERVGNGRLNVEYQDYSFDFQGVTTNQRNVIATLPGVVENSGVYVLVANYDTRVGDWMDGSSRSPGADDNGSGIANLLETARLLSSRDWNQTIIFAAVTAEEQGTYGSRYFVQDAVLSGLPISAAINNDMIGGRSGIPQHLRLFADGPDTSGNLQLARYIDFIGGYYLPTFRLDIQNTLDREDRWGDQREFVVAGIPAVRLIESEEDLSIQNSTRDSWDLIDYDYLSKVVKLNLVVLCNMLGAPPPPPQPIVSKMADPGSFILNWTSTADAAGYAISFRPLDTEGYPPFRFVNATQTNNVILTGFDSNTTYAVSIASIGSGGRLSFFSPELILDPDGTIISTLP